MLALGEGRFDGIVSIAALHELHDLVPTMRAAFRLLKPGGRFISANSHPCFNSGHVTFVAELSEADGRWRETRSVKIRDYLDERPVEGEAVVGQPTPTWTYHRTLASTLSPAFEVGLVMDAIAETNWPDDEEVRQRPGTHGWARYPRMASALVVRLRRPELG